MAMCPECFSRKWWLAPRCPECNEEIGFIRQTVTQIIFWSGFAVGIWIIWQILKFLFG
jgi:hypothetical protein